MRMMMIIALAAAAAAVVVPSALGHQTKNETTTRARALADAAGFYIVHDNGDETPLVGGSEIKGDVAIRVALGVPAIESVVFYVNGVKTINNNGDKWWSLFGDDGSKLKKGSLPSGKVILKAIGKPTKDGKGKRLATLRIAVYKGDNDDDPDEANDSDACIAKNQRCGGDVGTTCCQGSQPFYCFKKNDAEGSFCKKTCKPNWDCASDEADDRDNNDGEKCTKPDPACIGATFEEDDGPVFDIEFEDFPNNCAGDWKRGRKDGVTYLEWTGSENFDKPNDGVMAVKVNIKETGVYRFIWHSFIDGTESTEHNDSWLRIKDANDFYGKRGNHIVRPNGRCIGPIGPKPEGDSADGFLKIYRNGNTNKWLWQASTNDNSSHDVYAKFEKTGEYAIEVAGRSPRHRIDRIVLYHESTANNRLREIGIL